MDLLVEMYKFILNFEGDIPGAAPKDCGNYLDMNLPMAKYWANRFLKEVLTNISDKRLNYPK